MDEFDAYMKRSVIEDMQGYGPNNIPTTLPEPSDTAVIREITREIQARVRIYPTWIRERKISPKLAGERIKALEKAANDLHSYYTQGKPKQEKLF